MATPTALPAAFTVGQVLTSTQMNNLRGAFRILQVVQGTTNTQVSTASATYADVGLSVSITPSATSSKVLVVVFFNWYEASTQKLIFNLVRTATEITQTVAHGGNASDLGGSGFMMALDSPATTSATTYKVQFKQDPAGGAGYMIGSANIINRIVAMEISA